MHSYTSYDRGVSSKKMQQQPHQQQPQHLMQMQPMMASSYYPSNVTTDHIQQYLDENKSLILKIVESQNSGKMSECAENQARLQRNLMYLAAIADSQPQPPALQAHQFAPSGVMPAGPVYMQHPQSQQMTPQSLMAARSSMVYNTQQQPYSTMQQQQSLHSQLGMSSGLGMLQGNVGSSTPGFSEFGRESGRGGGEGHIGQHSGGSHSSDGN
uniref:SS18 N-terminal domain-containing protein n=3 Tax=Kalanchoe fedtschenkoi TaxID=63787 RepID=A0A7N0RE29_KALFE